MKTCSIQQEVERVARLKQDQKTQGIPEGWNEESKEEDLLPAGWNQQVGDEDLLHPAESGESSKNETGPKNKGSERTGPTMRRMEFQKDRSMEEEEEEKNKQTPKNKQTK